MIDFLRQAKTISNVVGAFEGTQIDVKYGQESKLPFPFVNRVMTKMKGIGLIEINLILIE